MKADIERLAAELTECAQELHAYGTGLYQDRLDRIVDVMRKAAALLTQPQADIERLIANQCADELSALLTLEPREERRKILRADTDRASQ